MDDALENGVAIIGMAGRFPGAPDIAAFWQNLRDGVESLSELDDATMIASGADPALVSDPHYVRIAAVLNDVDRFDAAFFGISRTEAELIDPQQRLLLECAWEAFESAGYVPHSYAGSIGVFAGASSDTYLHAVGGDLSSGPPSLLKLVGNDRDYLASRIAHKLNLTGPCVTVQTACSTSLVAVHLACQSLLDGAADMALAGGVTVRLPQGRGYLYEEGGLFSPDGRCRAFDADARGVLYGNGLGLVVLKALRRALADGDRVLAVIVGSAVNNDGAQKVAFTAPGVDGQSSVIAEAMAVADVDPSTVSYIECQGTGTPLGDAIEVRAMAQAFASVKEPARCGIGSVKTNIGHTEAAAGIAGLIKTVLALEAEAIPPTLHFQRAHPELALDRTPFYVVDRLHEWPRSGTPRRAGVSSFGIGGTNAHLVVQESPHVDRPSAPVRRAELVVLSAKTQAALEAAARRLRDHVARDPGLSLADVAYSAATTRAAMEHRLALAVSSRDALERSLRAVERGETPTHVARGEARSTTPKLAFWFSGSAPLRPGSGRALSESWPVFRKALDDAFRAFDPHLPRSLRDVMGSEPATEDAPLLESAPYAAAVRFALAWAHDALFRSCGVQPSCVGGEGTGEVVAAAVADVLTLADAARLVSGSAPESITYRSATVAFISSVTGAPMGAEAAGASHWTRWRRGENRSREARRSLRDAGVRCLELCSDPPNAGDGDEVLAFLRALGAWWTEGGSVDWRGVFPQGGRRVALPTYPFQRERYWLDAGPTKAAAAATAHPLRERLSALPEDERLGALVKLVQEEVAAVTAYDGDADRSILELGLDSVKAVELRNQLSSRIGMRLPATLAYDYPTAQGIAAALLPKILAEPRSATPTARSQDATDEPIAIVGMACRAPGGVVDPEGYWRLLSEGTDAIGPFPKRWNVESLFDPDPDAPGKSYVRGGGFLHDVDRFDASFFGISRREARAMDPQQRLVLETTWEALEHAGTDPSTLMGSLTGVYLGSMGADYGLGEASLEALDGYRGTGHASSVLSGRASYVLGLQGPAITVDTACSSSLVALHLACADLRRRECDMALAGGVQVMSTPATIVEFSRLRGVSPDGRCKAFSAAADGVGWAEGCGVVVLKRLSDARRDGDRILALLRGSAVNQDGRRQGLTAPNGPSQQRVIRRALMLSGVSPDDIDAVEAHGTGTALGDPIEAGALAEVFGPTRNGERPLWLGSAKSNIGHAQAAAGALGVIKMVLALLHERLPKTLHVGAPTEHVDWSNSGLALLEQDRPWPRQHTRVRRAGVSSFGVSGTNAHVVLEEAPSERPPPLSRSTSLPLFVSARDDVALRAQAERWAAWLSSHPATRWSDVVRTALGRTHFACRASIQASDGRAAAEALFALSQGRPHPAVTVGRAGPRGGVVFVFPGQGSQWPAMGRALLDECEAFAEAVAACDVALRPHTGWSLVSVLRGDETDDVPSLQRVDVVQPALFAMGVALAAAWRSLGVVPTAVVGQSQGEICAAVVAGCLSLEDGARVIARRSQLLMGLRGRGAMALAELSAEDVAQRLRDFRGLSIAAVSTPTSTVVSGDAEQVEAWLASLTAEEVFCRRVEVDYASHSATVDPILAELAQTLESLSPRPGTIPMVSTVTGTRVDGRQLDATYWSRNLRDPVRLDRAMGGLLGSGHALFVEISAHPVLAATLATGYGDEGATVVGSLRRDAGGLDVLHENLGILYTLGGHRDAKALLEDVGGKHVDLPTYAFQRQRYWLETRETGDAASFGLDPGEHRVLQGIVDLPDGSVVFTGTLKLSLDPATVVELALHAAHRFGLGVIEVRVEHAMRLAPGWPRHLQLLVAPPTDGQRSFVMRSRATEDGSVDGWTRHASGILGPLSATVFPPLESWPPARARVVACADVYERLEARGVVDGGAASRRLERAWQDGDTLYAEVSVPDEHAEEAFALHPALLEGALHALYIRPESTGGFPHEWKGVRLDAAFATTARVRLRCAIDSPASIEWFDAAGAPVASVESLRLRPLATDEVHVRPHTTSSLPRAVAPLRRATNTTLGNDVGSRPRNAVETLRHLLARVAPQTGAIAADADLFAAGLDSLSLLAFLRSVETEFSVPLRGALRAHRARQRAHLSLSSLARWLDGRAPVDDRAESTEPDAGPIPTSGQRRPHVLSRASAYSELFPEGLPSTLWRVGGHDLEVLEKGAGEPLLLLPPIGCEAVVWKPTMDRMADGRRIVAVNFPGYGRCPWRPHTTSAEGLAALVLALLDVLAPTTPVDVIGWSFGGFVAQALAATARPRLRTLTLVNTTSRLPSGESFADADHLAQQLVADLRRDLARTVDSPMPPEEASRLVFWGQGARPVGVFLDYCAMVERFDFRSRASSIRVPTLIVAGDEDLAVPTHLSRQMHSAIGASRLVVMPNVGHYIPVFQPGVFADLALSHIASHSSS